MELPENQEKLLDYLYGEMNPGEKLSFEALLRSDVELAGELHQLQNLRQAYQAHLPELAVPSGLRSKVLNEIGVKRSWWDALFGPGLLRPVMVGAFAFVLTLGLAYGLRDRTTPVPTVAQNTPAVSKILPGELGPKDFSAAANAVRLQPPRWHTSPQPSLSSGLVSLASYGSPGMPQSYGETSTFDIPEMEKDANMAIAQFVHQQAMRMRARGDFRGAAHELAKLIKQYPAYPHVFAAAAQRIDCLFRSGETDLARRELSWLGQQSPFLAQLVGQRWGL